MNGKKKEVRGYLSQKYIQTQGKTLSKQSFYVVNNLLLLGVLFTSLGLFPATVLSS